MGRVFWMAVGAVGGIAAYRRGTEAVARARELGPLGTAQVAAGATSRLADGTARGLGRLQELRDRRSGRLVVGSVEQAPTPTGLPGTAADRPVPVDWVPAATAAPFPTTPSVIVTDDAPDLTAPTGPAQTPATQPPATQTPATQPGPGQTPSPQPRPTAAGQGATATPRTTPRRRARHD